MKPTEIAKVVYNAGKKVAQTVSLGRLGDGTRIMLDLDVTGERIEMDVI